MKAINKMLVSLALVAVLVLGAVITLAIYSNGFESFAPLYLTDGEHVIGDKLDDIPATGKVLYVKRAGFDKNIGDYTVEIVPNPEYEFDYTADGQTYHYPSAFDNLTSAFNIIETDGGFILGFDGDVLGILAKLHGGTDVTSEQLPEGDPFILHVYTDYGETYINFGRYIAVTDIIIDPDGVIFYHAQEEQPN